MTEPYTSTAEFYDIVSAQRWAWLKESVVASLSRFVSRGVAVLDVGAGTGLMCVVGATLLAPCKWFALESDQAMRSILLSRVWADDLARKYVTVLPWDVESALKKEALPRTVDAVLLCGVLGHFSPPRRAELWRSLASRLSSGGVIIAEPQPPNSVEPIARTRFADAEIGEIQYEGWSEGVPSGPAQLEWRLNYVVRQHDRVIYEATAAYNLWPISAEGIREEAAAAGLVATWAGPGLLGFERPSG